MNWSFRKSLLVCGLTLACLQPLFAQAAPAVPTHRATHHASHHRHGGKSSDAISNAQRRLGALGYYNGKDDGVMGADTRIALKIFQKEHHLKIDGALGPKTISALAAAQPRILGLHSFPTPEPVLSIDQSRNGGSEPQADFATSMNTGTRVVSSRFARVDISESGNGGAKRYSVNLNGQPILTADGQPGVIGISPTYDLGSEDAVIFTTFSPNEGGCIYRSHVLAMDNDGTRLLDLDDCTRDYTAFAKNGTLFITFPQRDANSVIGTSYRLEGLDLVKM